MTTAIDVVNILSGDVPLFDVEDFVAEDLICMGESIENEPMNFVISFIPVGCVG